MVDRSVAQDLANNSIERGDPTGWFEELYRIGETEPCVVSWADKRPNPHLVSWATKNKLSGRGERALVVGCGYGDDAEWLASRGFGVQAFDIAPTAISAARRRFPLSRVQYLVADILSPPTEWRGSFDFVFEAYTLQVLKGEHRAKAARNIASLVKGTLLVIARAREENEEEGMMPWPLTKSDLKPLLAPELGLVQVSLEDFVDDENPPVRRFRLECEKSSLNPDHKKT